MPHKVNPIDFENAEGNIGLANSIFDFLSNKLPKSRLQRDLSDSTVLRNIGVPFGHSLISFESILKGLNKIYVNEEKINQDIEENWIVVSEAIQTILRREGYNRPYEIIKELTRNNQKIDKKSKYGRRFDNQKGLGEVNIPKLSDLLKLTSNNISDDLIINLEIKSTPVEDNITPPLNVMARLIIDEVNKTELKNKIIYSSFDWRVLREIKNFQLAN